MPFGHEDPPFTRDMTFFNGAPIDISVLTNIGGEQYEGKEYHYEDTVYGTGNVVTVRVVRNIGGTAILPCQMVKPATTDTNSTYPFVTRVSGLAGIGDFSFPADELMPAAGCPTNDLFYIVIRGPSKVISPVGGTATQVGLPVTAGAAGSATGQDLSGATTPLYNQLQNRVGRAMVAVTAGQTSTKFPIAVGW